LPVVVGVSQPMIFGLANAGRRIPKPIDCTFLLDTGAEDSYVNRLVLDQLRLNPINAVQVQTGIPGGQPFLFNQYEIRLRIATTVLGQMDFVLESMSILCGDFSAQGIDGLVGRDVLTNCAARFDGPGQVFTLQF
jgi:hypothetical protein